VVKRTRVEPCKRRAKVVDKTGEKKTLLKPLREFLCVLYGVFEYLMVPVSH
jgi:hypothetical protein